MILALKSAGFVYWPSAYSRWWCSRLSPHMAKETTTLIIIKNKLSCSGQCRLYQIYFLGGWRCEAVSVCAGGGRGGRGWWWTALPLCNPANHLLSPGKKIKQFKNSVMAVSNFFIYFFYFAGVVEGQKPTKSFRPRLWDTILIFYSISPWYITLSSTVSIGKLFACSNPNQNLNMFF